MEKKPDSKLDTSWQHWHTTGNEDDFASVMEAANPVIDSAIKSYAPYAPPAVRSKAKIIAANSIRTYDPQKGAKLQTHLHNQLQQIRREAASYDTLYAPEGVRMNLANVKAQQRNFFDEHGREPNNQELADFTGLSLKRIDHVRKFDRQVLSEGLFEERGDEGSGLPAVQQAAYMWEDYVYGEMGPKDKLIYDLKTGRGGQDPLTVNEIARKLGISAGAVSQRLAKMSDRIGEGKDLEKLYGKPV